METRDHRLVHTDDSVHVPGDVYFDLQGAMGAKGTPGRKGEQGVVGPSVSRGRMGPLNWKNMFTFVGML